MNVLFGRHSCHVIYIDEVRMLYWRGWKMLHVIRYAAQKIRSRCVDRLRSRSEKLPDYILFCSLSAPHDRTTNHRAEVLEIYAISYLYCRYHTVLYMIERRNRTYRIIQHISYKYLYIQVSTVLSITQKYTFPNWFISAFWVA